MSNGNALKLKPMLKKDCDLLSWVFIGVCGIFLALFLYPFLFKTAGIDKQLEIFYSRAENFMADLFNVCTYSVDRDPYYNTYGEAAEKAYFPLSYVIAFVFGRLINFDDYNGTIYSLNQFEIIGAALLLMMTSAVLAVCVYGSVGGSSVKRVLLVLAFMTSGPFIFTVERWNLILFSLIGMIVFVSTYNSENKTIRELGYLSLAFAAALKGYPAILGLLLIYRKEWKEAIRLAIYGAVGSFGPFLLVKHGFGAIPKWLSNLKANAELYEFRAGNCSGYRFFIVGNTDLSQDQMSSMISSIQAIVIIVSIMAVICSFFVKRDWIRIALLISLVIIMPSNSAYYNFLYYIPLVIVLIKENVKGPLEYLAAVLLAVLMMPYRINGENWFFDMQNTIVLANVCVLVMFILSVLYCMVVGIKEILRLIRQKRGFKHGKTQPA